MKTKEEFLQEAYGYKFEEEDFLNPAIAITLNAMEKYAQQQVKNLNIPDVSNTLQWCYNYIQKQKESDEKTALIKHLIECGVS